MATIISLILVIAIDYLLTAGLLAIVCMVLNWIGIFAIGSFTIAFSWKVVTALWILIIIFKIFFGKSTK